MLVCPNCGANITFDPKLQKLKCDFCDTELSPEEYSELHGAEANIFRVEKEYNVRREEEHDSAREEAAFGNMGIYTNATSEEYGRAHGHVDRMEDDKGRRNQMADVIMREERNGAAAIAGAWSGTAGFQKGMESPSSYDNAYKYSDENEADESDAADNQAGATTMQSLDSFLAKQQKEQERQRQKAEEEQRRRESQMRMMTGGIGMDYSEDPLERTLRAASAPPVSKPKPKTMSAAEIAEFNSGIGMEGFDEMEEELAAAPTKKEDTIPGIGGLNDDMWNDPIWSRPIFDDTSSSLNSMQDPMMSASSMDAVTTEEFQAAAEEKIKEDFPNGTIEWNSENTFEVTVYTCPQCGGELISDKTTMATFCSFCGSSVIFTTRIDHEKRPDYVIPFVVSQEECERAYKKLIRKSIFAPRKMRAASEIENFRGIYMPYWIYNFKKSGPVVCPGKTERRQGDYIYTTHYRLTTHVEADYGGISYDASSSFSDNLSEAIAPFDVAYAKPFEPSYLSGFYADTSDVKEYIYSDDVNRIVSTDISDEMMQDDTMRTHGADVISLQDNVRPQCEKIELGMFPVWFLACRHKDRVSYAVVNGQNGKVAADIPIDFVKYIFGSVLLAVPIFFLLNTFLTLKPFPMLVVTIIFAVASMLITNHQMNRIFARDNQLDDKGYNAVNEKRDAETMALIRNHVKKKKKTRTTLNHQIILIIVFFVFQVCAAFNPAFGVTGIIVMVAGSVLLTATKTKQKVIQSKSRYRITAPIERKILTLIKPLISVVLAVGILIWNPASDHYYYGAAAIAMIMVLISFFDIVRFHNRLTTRKLPQFNKRGGDM